MAVWRARQLGVTNFSVLVSHVTVPPAMTAILQDPTNRVQGFLAAGHVCTVMGWTEYEPIAARFKVPIVVTGFEPLDILEGIHLAVRQLESGRHEVENQYARAVTRDGTVPARIAGRAGVRARRPQVARHRRDSRRAGSRCATEFADFDAERRFALGDIHVDEPAECHAGEVLRGQLKPHQCPAFGTRCTPEHPLGAPMVSSEGACAAYYNYGRFRAAHPAAADMTDGTALHDRLACARPGSPTAPGAARARLRRQDERRAAARRASCPHFANPILAQLGDGAVLPPLDGELVDLDRHLRGQSGRVSRRQHRLAGGARHAQRRGDDGRRAALSSPPGS